MNNKFDWKDEKKVISALKYYDTLYHNEDEYFLSDEMYDTMKDKAEELYPNNDYFNKVGAEIPDDVPESSKVKHEFPMLSVQKVNYLKDLMKWINKIKYKGNFLAEVKLDGTSCSIIYEKGKIKQISTRGDGTWGESKNYISKYIGSIPDKISILDKIEIRGELIIRRDTELGNEKLRNIGSGIINRKETGLDDLGYLDFVAFQAIGKTFVTEHEMIGYILDLGFVVTSSKLLNVTELESFYDEYEKSLRSSYPYDSDGIVIVVNDRNKHDDINSRWNTDHHLHSSIAWKPTSKKEETTLLDIDWQLSKNGKLIPVAILEEVIIEGRKVNKASLSNYENVIKMKLEKGDSLLVEIANEIIPYVAENLSKEIKQR